MRSMLTILTCFQLLIQTNISGSSLVFLVLNFTEFALLDGRQHDWVFYDQPGSLKVTFCFDVSMYCGLISSVNIFISFVYIVVLVVASLIHCRLALEWLMFLTGGAYFAFYLAHWVTYCSGALAFGKWVDFGLHGDYWHKFMSEK